MVDEMIGRSQVTLSLPRSHDQGLRKSPSLLASALALCLKEEQDSEWDWF